VTVGGDDLSATGDALRASIRLQHQRWRRQALLAWVEHQVPDRRLTSSGESPALPATDATPHLTTAGTDL